jgi:hypothetical protein
LTRLIPSSTAFTLADGERKTLDLPGRRTGIGR